MKYRIIYLLGIVLLLGCIHPVSARQSSPPLTLLILTSRQTPDLTLSLGGDVWTWTERDTQLVRRTQWEFNYTPIFSPDGRYAAMRSIATSFVDELDLRSHPEHVVGWETSSTFPVTIWLVDTITFTGKRIADQPAVYDLNKSNHIMRSDPTWAPDSSAVAWTEVTRNAKGQFLYQIVIYDIAKDRTRTISIYPADRNVVIAPISVEWRRVGLTLRYFDGPASSPTRDDKIIIYEPSGNILFTISVGSSPAGWVFDDNKEYLLWTDISTKPNKHYLIDPYTQVKNPFDGVIERYNPQAPDGIRLVADGNQWTLVRGDGTSRTIQEFYDFAISPDGQEYAYTTQQANTEGYDTYRRQLFLNDQVEPLVTDYISDISWGHIETRIRRNQ
jgi:hypothetical protein